MKHSITLQWNYWSFLQLRLTGYYESHIYPWLMSKKCSHTTYGWHHASIYKTCKLAILYRCTWWRINEHHMYRYILNMTQRYCNVRPKDSKYNLIWQKTNYISLKVTLVMYFLHLWNICYKKRSECVWYNYFLH